jgi:hypothetical protein
MYEQALPQSACYSDHWAYLISWNCVSWPTWQGKEKAALFQKGVATSNCKLGTCSFVNFNILNPEELRWKIGHKVDIIYKWVGH